MKAELAVEIDDRHPLGVIYLSGSIAAMEVYKVKALADSSLRDGNKYFILDLTKVSFLDSAGIGLVLQIRNACHSAGGAVILVRPLAPQVQRALEIASLHTLIPFFDTLIDALEYARIKFGVILAEVSPTLGPEELTEMVRDLTSRLTQVEQRLVSLAQVEERLARLERDVGK